MLRLDLRPGVVVRPEQRCLFFFFQAEDGIRDLIVTGVQTCALPISARGRARFHRESAGSGWKAPLGRPRRVAQPAAALPGAGPVAAPLLRRGDAGDRKSTRLNSSHDQISYAVFCLKKKIVLVLSSGA